MLGLEGHETLTRAIMGNKQSKQLADIECKHSTSIINVQR